MMANATNCTNLSAHEMGYDLLTLASYTSHRHKLSFFCKCVSDVLTHAKDVTIEMTPFAPLRPCVELKNKNAKTRGRKDAKIK